MRFASFHVGLFNAFHWHWICFGPTFWPSPLALGNLSRPGFLSSLFLFVSFVISGALPLRTKLGYQPVVLWVHGHMQMLSLFLSRGVNTQCHSPILIHSSVLGHVVLPHSWVHKSSPSPSIGLKICGCGSLFTVFHFPGFLFFLMLLCHVTERASFIFLIPSSTFFMGLFSALRSPPDTTPLGIDVVSSRLLSSHLLP